MTTLDDVSDSDALHLAKFRFDRDNEDIALTWDQAFPHERRLYVRHALESIVALREAGFVVTRAAS